MLNLHNKLIINESGLIICYSVYDKDKQDRR